MVDEAVGDAGLVGDVRDAAGVEALAGEHAHGRVEDLAGACLRSSSRARRARAPGAGRSRRLLLRASGRPRRGGWPATAGCARISRWRSRSSSATMWPSPSGAWASTTPHGSTIIERPPECWPAGCAPNWLAAITNSLVLDRAGAQQRLPVVARGREREGGRDRDQPRARARRGCGTARGSAGRSRSISPSSTPSAVSREDDLLARLLELGLAVDAPADLDVEHVQLAVDAR